MALHKDRQSIQTTLGVTTFVVLLSFLSLTWMTLGTIDKNGPVAVEGVLDLREWNFEDGETLRLNGDWEFYWHSLLSPEDVATNRGTISGYTGSRYWNGYTLNGEKLSGQGYATYVLRIMIEPDGRRLALRIPSQSTSFRLFMNGREIAANGQVGTSAESSIPKYLPLTVQFSNDHSELTLIMQVSNFDHRRGGMWSPMELGLEDTMRVKNARLMLIDMVSIGSMFTMGLYHFLLFGMRQKDRSTIYFAGICMCYGIHALVVGETAATKVYPNISWAFQLRLEYLTSAGILPLGLLFVWELYSEDVKLAAVRAGIVLYTLFSVMVVFFPTAVGTQSALYYQAGSAILSWYMIYVLILARIRKREGAAWLAASAAVFLISLLNDFLHYNGFIHTAIMSSRGMVLVCYAQAYVLASRFSGALTSVETLKDDLTGLNQRLIELNIDLEERVSERTHDLMESNKRLEAINAEIERIEQSRKHLLANVAHDLRTPVTLIQGYVEAMMDGIIEEPEQRAKYLSLIAGKADGLSHLITDLFELTQLESRRVTFDIHPVLADELVGNLFMKYETDIVHAGVLPVLEKPSWVDCREEERPWVLADPERIDRVVSNLIYNSLKFTPKGGTITVSYRLEKPVPESGQKGSVVFSVADSGAGIAAKDLPFVFDRFYKVTQSRNQTTGSGLGLSIAREIVEVHGGRIWVESSMERGSVFSFTLPLAD